VSFAQASEPTLEILAVPKVAVAEHDNAVLAEDDVGTTDDIPPVHGVAKASTPQFTPKAYFAARIPLNARSTSG
jgi:hypothetical protein